MHTASEAALPAETHPGSETWAPILPHPSLGNKKQTRSSSHPAFFSLRRTCRTTLYSYGIIHYLKVNTNISIFSPVFHTHTSKRFQLFVEHYRKPSAFSSFFHCPGIRTVTSWKSTCNFERLFQNTKETSLVSLPTPLFWLTRQFEQLQ